MSSGQGTGAQETGAQAGKELATHELATQTNPSEPQPSPPGAGDGSGQSQAEPPAAQSPDRSAASGAPAPSTPPASGGPLSIERIRQLRASQNAAPGGQRAPERAPRAARPPQARPAPEAIAGGAGAPVTSSTETIPGQTTAREAAASGATAETSAAEAPSPKREGEQQRGGEQRGGDRGRRKPLGKQREQAPPAEAPLPKLEVPSRRAALSSDLQNEFEQALAGTDLDRMLIGDALVQVGRDLEEGQRVQGRVLKVHGEHVFVSLGGPNEGVISILQFPEPPAPGTQLDVIVRGFLIEEGLYDLAIPGSAVTVDDWSDIKEGEVVEAKVTAANAGGLECTVGNARGFIPASQVAEFRVEDFSEFIDQKVLCVVTQCNPARGNLVLSRRAVLERERAEKREQRLRDLEVGATVEGTVRKLMDFGAFVDIGGLDGLLHISQLSWEKIKHPSEVLEEGQKIQVRVDKIDPQSGKIGLSYRSLQDHPWSGIQERFPVGAIVHGTVSRIADFGAFVRLATGVEGLVHLSELAHHRVHKISNVVQEGQEVDVKVLSVEPERQRMSLSLKAAQQAPASETPSDEPEVEEAPRELALPKHRGPLKGGIGRSGGGEQFGLKW